VTLPATRMESNMTYGQFCWLATWNIDRNAVQKLSKLARGLPLSKSKRPAHRAHFQIASRS
jgi:hypothetical protein